MDLELAERVAVVTGASKGIGLAVTHTLMGAGAQVVGASRSPIPEPDELSGELHHVPADFMDPRSPARVIGEAVERFGGVDVLVNNVGGAPRGVTLPRSSFFDADDADWNAVFELNLFAAVRCCRAAIPVMVERGGGAIVNISSVNGRQPSPMNVDYGAAKAALTNLGQALSEEFGPAGIRVNTVSPGPVRTPWWTEAGGAAEVIAERAGADPDTVLSTLAPEMMHLTTGRLAEPQEVADAVVLLASPRSGSTTGTDMVVDSGMLKTA
jgi:NAD(P)-dependent dehydrogenase (short-subunit alcohol dehydrogenase family)